MPEANAKTKPGTLERYQLPVEVRESLQELRALSKRAENGDQDAKKELRHKLREASPAVIARASDVGRKAQNLLISTISAGDPLTQDALSVRLDMMREEIAGENPTPLEVLLTERVVSCWVLVELFDALMSAQLWRDAPPGMRSSPSYLKHMIRWQESANRRYLAAIRELVRVRKLQATIPPVQVNTQVNILQG